MHWNFSDNSSHSLDAIIGLNFSRFKVPINFTWSTIILGNDVYTDDLDQKKRSYSSYTELRYTQEKLFADITFSPYIGVVMRNRSSYYKLAQPNGISIVSLGLKTK